MITSTISTIVASGIVTKVCAGMFGTSALITAAKNNGAKHKIERQGFKVDRDRRSITERLSSFIKDYFFLIVPGYNIYKSFKTFLKNDEEYAEDRKKIYDARERLIPDDPRSEEATPAPVPARTEEVVREEVPARAATPAMVRTPRAARVAAAEPVVSTPARVETPARATTSEPFAGLSVEQLEDLENHYKRLDKNLRKKYEREQAAGATVEQLNAIALQTIENKKLYTMVHSRLEIMRVSAALESSRVLR